MDRRGWPWKKKSSDKITKGDIPFVAPDSVGSTLSSVAHLGNQVFFKKFEMYVCDGKN
jgi:hypothetical protein